MCDGSAADGGQITMVHLGTAPTIPTAERGAPPERMQAGRVRRPRRLPGGRAVVGGLLVGTAAVGTFAAWSSAAAGPSAAYVTVARDVRAGERLERADLRLVALDLPEAQRSGVFDDAGVLDGAVALAPLGAGELVQSSAVARPAGGTGTAQVSFAVPPSDALGGRMKPGERVDILAVYGTGPSATVERATEGALLVDVTREGGPVAGGGLTLTVAVPAADVDAVALASSAGTVKVVRATNLAAGA
jgi:Flp pilus assembly protein CpaB